MNPVLKRPEVWVLAILTLVGAGFVIVSQRSLDEELKKPPVPSKTGTSPETAAVRFDLDSVVQRKTGDTIEIEIAGTVRNGGKTKLDLRESARLAADGESKKPIFLASNSAFGVAAGEQRKVILPFVFEKAVEDGKLLLEIADWSGRVR